MRLMRQQSCVSRVITLKDATPVSHAFTCLTCALQGDSAYRVRLSVRFCQNPKLNSSASLICCIISGVSSPIFSLIRLLSMVRICSKSTTESLGKGECSFESSMCVGSLAFVSFDVVAAAIIVGLYLFPTSFCNTTIGRIPPCSLPTTGFKSA